MLKNIVSTDMLKELSSTFDSSKKILLIGQFGAGKSSLTNVLMNCTTDDLDPFEQYAHVGNVDEKVESHTIFVRSYPVLGNQVNVVDFVGLNLLGEIEDDMNKVLTRIARGMYPPPDTIFDRNTKYKSKKEYIPDFVYWVVDCPSIAASSINIKKSYNRLRKIFKHENIFIIFNKMDHFLNKKPEGNGATFNLKKKYLKDINFNLQEFVVGGEKITEDSIGDKSVEKSSGDKSVEKSSGDKSVEKSSGDKSVEKSSGDKSVEDTDENIMEDSTDKSVEDTVEFNYYNVAFKSVNGSFKMWCVNDFLWPVSEGLSLMKNEARKLLYKTLKTLQIK